MLQLSIKAAKAGFFDRGPVLRAVDAASRGVLSRFGAFVRTRARSSIRKRKRTSQPGSPPSSHTGLLKQFLFFVYDDAARSVLIGPARLNKPGLAPATLEFGGEAVISDRRGDRKVRIAPRPFMRPALDAELPSLPAMWRDSVR